MIDGARGNSETQLLPALSPEQRCRIEDLLDEYLLAQELQQPVTPQQLCSEDQALLVHLLHRIERLQRFDRLTALDENSETFEHFGPYQVIRKIGSGGSGRVFLCRHRQLSRLAAVKVIPLSADTWTRQQFENEVEVVRTFDHDGIATIYDSDLLATRSGTYGWLAMEYFSMGRIDDYVREQQKDEAWVLQCVTDICATLFAAEQRKILHRDIKPGNILVDDAGRPHLSDFGLAQSIDARENAQGAAVQVVQGTPSFMAPELSDGNQSADVSSEIYSLGVVLFTLLSGQHPFKSEYGDTPAKVVEAAKQAPPSLRERRPNCSKDLEHVVARMLAPSPTERYRTYGDVLADLYCLQEGRPVSARPIPLLQRSLRWARRNPLLAGLCSAFTIVLAAMAVQLLMNLQALRHSVDEIQSRNVELSRQKQFLKQAGVSSRLRAVQEQLTSHPSVALRKLQDTNLFPESMHHFAWHYLLNLAQQNEADLSAVGGGFNPIHRLHFTPDDRTLIVRSKPGVLAFVNLRDQTRRDLPELVRVVSTPLFHPDRTTFYVHKDEHSLLEIDWRTVAVVSELGLPEAACARQVLSADGRSILGVTKSGFPFRFVPETHEYFRGDDAISTRPCGLWLNPDEDRLHCVTTDSEWIRWETERLTVAEQSSLKGLMFPPNHVPPKVRAVSAEACYTAQFGPCITVSFGFGQSCTFWPESNHAQAAIVRSSALTSHAAFRNGSHCLLPDGRNGLIFSVLDPNDRRQLSSQTDNVLSVAISHDGAKVATGGSAGKLMIRNLPEPGAGRYQLPLYYGIQDPGFGPPVRILSLPDQNHMICVQKERWISLLDRDRQDVQQYFTLGDGQIADVDYSAQSRLLAFASRRPAAGIVLIKQPTDSGWPGRPAAIQTLDDAVPDDLAPDDSAAANAGFESSLPREESQPQKSTSSAMHIDCPDIHARWDSEANVARVAFLPDGRQLIVGLRNGTLVKIDADTGSTLQRNEQLQKSAYTYSICTTPDLVFCGCRDGLIRIYDHSLTLQQQWKAGTNSVRSLVVDQRHNRVFAGLMDGSIVMFNLSGQRLSQMIGHDQAAASLAVSPDGRTLASGGGDFQICIWDTATNEQQLVLRGHRDTITDLCFSADGLTLWSTSADGNCYRWTGTSQQAISSLAASSQ